MRLPRQTATILSILLLSACAAETMPDAPEGARFFADNCVACHGQGARGDGAAAPGLDQVAPDLTQLSARNGGTFPTARALSYIYGDPDNNHVARLMPQFGGAMGDDLVPVEVEGTLTPTPRTLAALLAYLQEIQR